MLRAQLTAAWRARRHTRPPGVCTGHPLFVRDMSMGSRLSISGSKCVAKAPHRNRTTRSRAAPESHRLYLRPRIAPPRLTRRPAPRRWVASSGTVDGVSLFDVKGGVKLMEGAQSVLPKQRALPTASEAVLQLGQMRFQLLPDLTRTRPQRKRVAQSCASPSWR